jgi:hypothetical protein
MITSRAASQKKNKKNEDELRGKFHIQLKMMLMRDGAKKLKFVLPSSVRRCFFFLDATSLVDKSFSDGAFDEDLRG